VTVYGKKPTERFRPKRPRLGALGSSLALPLVERVFRRKQIFRTTGPPAAGKRGTLKEMLVRGEITLPSSA